MPGWMLHHRPAKGVQHYFCQENRIHKAPLDLFLCSMDPFSKTAYECMPKIHTCYLTSDTVSLDLKGEIQLFPRNLNRVKHGPIDLLSPVKESCPSDALARGI